MIASKSTIFFNFCSVIFNKIYDWVFFLALLVELYQSNQFVFTVNSKQDFYFKRSDRNNCKQCTNDFQGGGKDFLVLFVLVDNFEVVVTLDTFTVQQPRDIFLAARGESAHESQFGQTKPFRRLQFCHLSVYGESVFFKKKVYLMQFKIVN